MLLKFNPSPRINLSGPYEKQMNYSKLQAEIALLLTR